jgi:hypothetical protein
MVDPPRDGVVDHWRRRDRKRIEEATPARTTVLRATQAQSVFGPGAQSVVDAHAHAREAHALGDGPVDRHLAAARARALRRGRGERRLDGRLVLGVGALAVGVGHAVADRLRDAGEAGLGRERDRRELRVEDVLADAGDPDAGDGLTAVVEEIVAPSGTISADACDSAGLPVVCCGAGAGAGAGGAVTLGAYVLVLVWP